MKRETITIAEKNGQTTTAHVVLPDDGNNKAVIIVQEYWGLNDHIKDIAERYAALGFCAIAPDLYHGIIAADSTQAAELMEELSSEVALDIIGSTIETVTRTYGISHFGITGYCMGGTFALLAACQLEGLSAAAPFYGDIPTEDILQTLSTPTLFISAKRDQWINEAKVAYLEDVAERFELPVTSVKYDADHAFFNDTRPNYSQTAAEDAWALVTAFFNDRL